MVPPLPSLLVTLLAVALALAGTAAGETTPPPEELAPPPPPAQSDPAPAPPDEPEPGPTTITILVPPAPVVKPERTAAKRPAPVAPAAVERREAPRSEPRMRERTYTQPTAIATEREPIEPAATKPKPKAKPKPKRMSSRPSARPAAGPDPPAPRYPAVVRDRTPASAVLGAQHTPQAVASSADGWRAPYLVLVLTVAGALLLAVAGAAPTLAWYWPEIFVPVIRERDGVSFFGVSLVVCGLVAWAIVAPGI